MKRIKWYQIAIIVLVSPLVFLSLSCGSSSDPQPGASAATDLPDSLFLAAAPAGVEPIASLKQKAREGDTVVINAVIGGRSQPFVNDRAVMTVVDAQTHNPCLAEGHHCPTPWDYCCTPPEELISDVASVQIVGADNRPLAVDLKDVENLKPLTRLVIRGTIASRTDQTTLVVNAEGIYVAESGS